VPGLLGLIAVGRDLDLLPFSLAHYARLGLDRLLLVVHAGLSPGARVPARVTEWARTFGAEIAGVRSGEFVGTRRDREAALARVARPDDWVVLADLDEFHAYPGPLRDVVAACEANGYDYVTGELVDRVACDGGFPPIGTRPLSEQFPAAVRLTANVCGGDVAKVVLARAGVRVTEGQHRALEGVACPPRTQYVPVHHFKWDAGVFQRARSMAAAVVHPGDPAADRWRRRERERFFRYVESSGGRLPLEDPLLDAHVPPSHRCGACSTLPRRDGTPVRPDDPDHRRPRRAAGASLEPDGTGVWVECAGRGRAWLDLEPGLAVRLWRLATGNLTVRQLRIHVGEGLGRPAAEVDGLVDGGLAALERAGVVSCR
jgi:hypothetical protein